MIVIVKAGSHLAQTANSSETKTPGEPTGYDIFRRISHPKQLENALSRTNVCDHQRLCPPDAPLRHLAWFLRLLPTFAGLNGPTLFCGLERTSERQAPLTHDPFGNADRFISRRMRNTHCKTRNGTHGKRSSPHQNSKDVMQLPKRATSRGALRVDGGFFLSGGINTDAN